MSSESIKKLKDILTETPQHWVGDGFPVRTLFSYSDSDVSLSPFLLLDYAGPAVFSPTNQRRGVGAHPHRGFETVTIVYDGEVEHRDSSGGGGVIGPGDVQWMTAGAGVVHEEFHGKGFAQRGGKFEMIQLWVNLPAKDKMTSPHYQAITGDQIPVVRLPDSSGTLRVISGEYAGTRGPAESFTPLNVWDMQLAAGQHIDLSVPDGHTALLLVLQGAVRTPGSTPIREAGVALFERRGNRISVDSDEGAKALFLSGTPIDEPVAGRGPFVMNTEEEILQAIEDYQNGKMGRLS